MNAATQRAAAAAERTAARHAQELLGADTKAASLAEKIRELDAKLEAMEKDDKKRTCKALIVEICQAFNCRAYAPDGRAQGIEDTEFTYELAQMSPKARDEFNYDAKEALMYLADSGTFMEPSWIFLEPCWSLPGSF